MAFFINKQINSKIWSVRHCTRDLSVLTLHGLDQLLHIFNIYNPGLWDRSKETDKLIIEEEARQNTRILLR